MTESKTTLKVVSVSGGKDSTACLMLALERHPVREIRAVFADTGNEHELTLEYVHNYLPKATGVEIHTVRGEFSARIERKAEFVRTKWAEHGVAQEKIDRALAALKPTGNPYLDLCVWKGRFPSRKAQFCTEELKTIPLGEWQLDLIDQGFLVESWQGVRADESMNRANLPERQDRGGGFSIYRPVLRWTAQQTVDYVRSRGVLLNPLYSMGMNRVGCMPCVNARKDEVLEISKRFPGHIDRIEAWERAVMQASKRDGATFFAGANEGGGLSVPEAVARSNIRAIVEWSKTSRGGKQYDMIVINEEPAACASAYGLCE